MASTASIATTLTPTRDTLSSSQLLSSSISSLNGSSRHASNQISKIYRQSSTLFLTRRLPESLSTILPVITPPPSDDTNATVEAAPIATASRTTRIKVWSLYLTILNAIVELDPEEGKQAFGSQEWRALVTKIRDGEVWEEVVNNGYGGVEGNVDSDVVINLATLLLAHAPTQKINQTRLESYLASSHTPNLDLIPRIPSPTGRRPSRTLSPSKRNGTDTPRDLNARVKILELYTLHVLLRNNEWDYSREFITMSEILDEERREAFLQALQSLRDEQEEAERREREERRYQEEQLRRDNEEARRRRVESEERERKRQEEEQRQKVDAKKAASSETDYGVENTPPSTSHGHKTRSSRGSMKGSRSSQVAASASPTARSSIPGVKNNTVPPSLLTRATKIVANLKALLENMAMGFSTRPLVLIQTLAFVIGLLVVLSRRDVKALVGRGWEKVRRTAGMGVKVSYI